MRGKGKKKQICAAGQTGRVDPSRFIFLQIEKKNYRDGPYIALDLGSPMAPWLAVVWLGLVGRACRGYALLTPPLFFIVECEISTPSSILMQPIVSCIYRVAHVISRV